MLAGKYNPKSKNVVAPKYFYLI